MLDDRLGFVSPEFAVKRSKLTKRDVLPVELSDVVPWAMLEATGDAINAVLAAIGNNFRRLLNWLRFWRAMLLCTLRTQHHSEAA